MKTAFQRRIMELEFDLISPPLLKYSDDEERDDHGRWTSGGGGQEMPYELQPRFTNAREFFPDLKDMLPGNTEGPSKFNGETGIYTREIIYGPHVEEMKTAWLNVQHAQFEEVAKESVKVDVSPKTLAAILDDGRMKTAYEVPSSRAGGNYANNQKDYLEIRQEAETKYMGVPENTPAQDRPVYGYLTQGENFEDYKYGAITVTLKDDVKDRTTMSAFDSLDGRLTPAPVSEAAKGTLSDQQVWEASGPRTVNDSGGIRPISETPYYEAQIHGGVKLSDIASVALPSAEGLMTQRQRDNIDSGKTTLEAALPKLETQREKLVTAIQAAGIKVVTK